MKVQVTLSGETKKPKKRKEERKEKREAMEDSMFTIQSTAQRKGGY